MEKKHDELSLIRNISRISKGLQRAVNNRLKDTEIQRYYSILVFIDSNEEGCTQQAICDEFHIDKASMVRIADQLTTKGYVKRKVNSDDRRGYLIQLTAKGKKRIPEIQKAVHDSVAAASKGLSGSDLRSIHEALRLLNANLEKE